MLLAIGCGAHAAKLRSDFDGDGKDDVLSRNASTAQNYIYFMDGTKVRTAGFVGNPPGASTAWTCRAAKRR